MSGFEFINVEAPSQPLPTPNAYKNIKFAQIMEQDASGKKKAAMNARSVASDIPLNKLMVSAEQFTALEDMYRPRPSATPDRVPVDHLFKLDDGDQLHAAAIMVQHGLDLEAREDLSNRWSQQWSRTGGGSGRNSKASPNSARKILYLCACGYDHTRNESKKRQTPVPFTGCLGHAEITFVIGSQKILRIRGYFEHNEGCKEAVFTRIPPIPVHPSVFAVALAQLKDGATFTDVKKKNLELYNAGRYKDFPAPADLPSSPYRWLIDTKDSRSLMRQFNRLNGVKVTERPQINIDEWLDPTSSQYNATLAEAIFHYSARTDKSERFEACIATEDMRRAAWKYGHENQIIVDGTFGVCDSRILLFIIMVVDENKKGVPVAFLLFSAPTGNKQSSAGYNTTILEKLFRTWTVSLTNCGHLYGSGGALVLVIPTIWLLICRFHLRQSWKNYRNKLLKGKGQLKIDLKRRLKRLEDDLVQTQDIEEARSLLDTEKKTLRRLGRSKTISKAIKHVEYLSSYWTTDELWKSWSDYGRKVAAALLGCHIDGVIPTTNHLESFNGVLKRKHLQRWQNGNRRLRVDVLIQVLVMHIPPSIFQARRLYYEQSLRLAAQIRGLPGGHALLQQRFSRPTIPAVAYLTPDQQRDERAASLVRHRQISAPSLLPDDNGLTFQCYSSEALEVDQTPAQYTITILFNGAATCKCQDFQKHGGACKHLRAAVIYLDWLRTQGTNIPVIPIPRSIPDTYALEQRILPSIPKPDVPTAHAASIAEDMLASHDDAEAGAAADTAVDEDDFSDTESVATDASSDSDDGESDHDDDEPVADESEEVVRGPEIPSALKNQQALGEQALARALWELEDMGPKFLDLAEFLKHNRGPLVGNARQSLSERCQPIMAFTSELQRLCSGDVPPSSTLPKVPPSSSTAARPTQNLKRKRSYLLPPSPEKPQKRHQSYSYN
ncbi:hypothetical protein MVEN_00619500 [Mycena venus]|uniref:SWIM-type domain-containing protein n=1 Tax=Mycena venus TaxID=2733690 RepID=A0A8H6YPD7_9AGAR|nr:hypothetical protein MVEN_00619500 [Mycena venus]